MRSPQRTSLNMKNINAGVPHGSVLGSLLFLIYVNDLTEDLTTSVKLFVDDTTLFSVVRGTHICR